MSRKDDPEHLLAQLTAALDMCGAKPQRWPEDMRVKLSAFVEQDVAARQLFAETRALDQVLSLAPDMPPPHGLEARILAAASWTETEAASKADSAHRPKRNGQGALSRQRGMTRAERRIWPELAVLAASLLIGVVIGVSGQALPALHGMGVIAANQSEDWSVFTGSLFDPDGLPDQEAL